MDWYNVCVYNISDNSYILISLFKSMDVEVQEMSEEVKNEEKRIKEQKQRRKPNKNFGEAWKAIKWVAICIMVVTVVINIKGPMGTAFSLIKDGKQPATSITIEHGLRDLSSLNTAEYYYTHLCDFGDVIPAPIFRFDMPFTDNRALYTCNGFVKAGLDFSKIEVKKFGKHITVTLPLPEITSSEIDHDSFKICYERNSIFNPIKVEQVNNSFADIKKDEETKAIETGLYTRAVDNAKLIIESFIRSSFDYKEWEIEFKETESELSDTPEVNKTPTA